MRLLHPSLGLTALVAAFAVGVRTQESAPLSQNTPTKNPSSNLDHNTATPTTSQRSRNHSSRTLSTARQNTTDPRLEELTASLALSHDQQARILPELLRTTFAYNPEQPYQLGDTQPARLLGPPLTRADFEDALFAILDVEQQLDYVATVTEKEAWWKSIVSRLEADLETQTPPTLQIPPPSHHPDTAPSSGRGRQLQLPPVTE